MAGFVIVNKKEITDEKKEVILNSLLVKGFDHTYKVSYSNYEIIYVRKKIIEDINLIEDGDDFVLSQGTFVYKKYYGKKALKIYYKDFINNSVDNSLIFGHFNIIFSFDGNIMIKSDAYYSLPIYYNESRSVLTSFFLTLCDITDRLTPNVDVIASNVITGCLYDPLNTYFKEIKRLNGSCTFSSISHHVLPIPLSTYKAESKNFDEELTEHKKNISYIVDQIDSLLRGGVDVGLSAGFDSRLILAIISNSYLDKMRLHTHWKKKPDNEVLISRQLAKAVNKPLNEHPVMSFKDCSDAEKKAIALQSFYFYDGQVRVNHNLFSQYRNPSYRKALLGEAKLGLTGLGGEQYRNDLSFVYSKYPLNWYIREYIFDSTSEIKFFDDQYKNDLIGTIKSQIIDTAGIKQTRFISKNEIRLIFNRVWVKSGPGYRNVAENQLSYFISPFNDPFLSESALGVQNIGFSVKFQSALINLFNSRLAGINSNYKISFNQQNYIYRLNRLALGILIPAKTKRSMVLSRLKNRKNIPLYVKDFKDDFYWQYIELFKKNCPYLDVSHVKVNSNSFYRICGIGLLLKVYQDKINLNSSKDYE